MMFVSLNSNTKGVVSWAETANFSGVHEFTLDFSGVCVAPLVLFT